MLKIQKKTVVWPSFGRWAFSICQIKVMRSEEILVLPHSQMDLLGLIWHMTYWFLTSGNNQRDFVWSLYPMLPHPGRIAVVFVILLSVVCMTRGSIKCYSGFSNSNILLYLRPKIRTNMTVELFLKALRARQYYDVNEVNIYHLLNNW